MVSSAPVMLASADGASTLALWLDDGTPCLRLCRGDRVVLSRVRLRGLPAPAAPANAVQAPACWPIVEAAGALRLALTGGAYVQVTTTAPAPAEVVLGGSLVESAAAAFRVVVRGAVGARTIEADLPLDELGPMFGLGHLMAQHWPLQEGCLELGPFYPFDNGPNGVCTMAVPTVVAASGVAVVCHEEETHCLHLSLNACSAHIGELANAASALTWGVGIANFDRKILPVVAADKNGDGLLTLQSRAAYDWQHVIHPWLVSEPALATDLMTHAVELGFESEAAETIHHSEAIDTTPTLSFSIGAHNDVRQATERLVLQRIRETFPLGRTIPPIAMMRYPIWTTWAPFKDAVDQVKVLKFAHDIAVKHDLPRSIMEIDDRWSVKYGDLEFDRVKFPDPQSMVSRLHDLDFLVTLWVIPFANLDSDAVTNPKTRGYFVKGIAADVGGFEWWQPTKVAALDVTNDEACDWFLSRLGRLQLEYGIDSFKFDAGEPCFLPGGCVTHKPLKRPSDYTRAWISKIASKFDLSECRAAVSGTEAAPPLLRLFDRFSTWGLGNGLASVITAMLTASALGYPFVLPDMIGGNAYDGIEPDNELMIRWAQATSAMPSMQFSIPPWTYGEECTALCAAALRWRSVVFWPVLSSLHEPAARSFAPIARPLWWAEPERADAVRVGDQFMLGDDMVVAPVVERGARSRRAFLPSGQWRRVLLSASVASAGPAAENGTMLSHVLCGDAVIEGPCWLEAAAAPLHDMPVWLRADGMHQA